MAQEISIPVKLQIQNLQGLVDTLQKQLSNLKVGSTGFKNIQSIIHNIKGEIDKLQVSTSKPFVDARQFTQAEHSVDKLEDEIEKVSLTMSRLKFSDLELTSDQKNDLKAFEDQLQAIKDKLRTVKDAAKQSFLNSAEGQIWQNQFDDKAFSKSLSEMTKDIRKEADEQKRILEEAKQNLADYQSAIKSRDSIEQFLKAKDPLSKANIGDTLYDQIFSKNNPNHFAKGGRSMLADMLKNSLKLTDAEAHELTKEANGSAGQVIANLKVNLQKLLNDKNNYINSNGGAQQAVDAAKASYQQLLDILRQVGVEESSILLIEGQLRQDLNNTATAASNYKDRLAEMARNNQEVQNTTSMMKAQLTGFRDTLIQTSAQFLKMSRIQQSFNQMKMAVVNFMGFTQVLNLTKRAVREAINHIKELDTVMNKISIVTDMSTEDLWQQVDQYSKMAQAYGTTIKGAYEVSQIYYQQGLETNDVLTLTNETLKLAKVSGLDYATTTDYMTTALRGFKMEMSEASKVVDVYSNLAAHTAVSSEELAVAMSKTASSMESVGSTFEETSAMIGTMVAVTRESATNIGSALKSIASRYGEMKSDPLKLVDSEGDEMSFNKVDAALQSVGITMKTVDGQFRNFTDVILELSEKWDQLESTQQRYIATQFAGNRQQSRFLALVSNPELLKANIGYAEESEDTGTLQALKALDSIESKLNQVQVAYQQFYTTMGAENVWKSLLDGATNVINTLNSFPKLFGKLPIGAIAAVSTVVSLIKQLGTNLITGLAKTLGSGLAQGFAAAENSATQGGKTILQRIIEAIKGGKDDVAAAVKEVADTAKDTANGVNQIKRKDINTLTKKERIERISQNKSTITRLQSMTNASGLQTPGTYEYTNLFKVLEKSNRIPTDILSQYKTGQIDIQQAVHQTIIALQQENTELDTNKSKFGSGINSIKAYGQAHQKGLESLASFGQGLSMVGMMIDTTREGGKTASSIFMGLGGTISAVSQVIAHAGKGLSAIPWMAVLSGAMMVINAISTLIVTPEERLEELEKKAEELNNKAKEAKANYRTLDNSIKKLNQLEQARHDSAEAAEEYQSAVESLTDTYPALIKAYKENGDAVLNANAMEQALTKAREKAADAAFRAAQAEADVARQKKVTKKDAIKTSNDMFDQYLGYNFTGIKGSFMPDALYSAKTSEELEEIIHSPEHEVILSILEAIHKASEQSDADEIVRLNDSLITFLANNKISLSNGLQQELNKVVNAAKDYLDVDELIKSADQATVSAFVNKSFGNSSNPLFKTSSNLLVLASEALYSVMEDANVNNFSESLMTSFSNDLFKDISTWGMLSDEYAKELENILENSENYTAEDLKTKAEKYNVSVSQWLLDVFERQADENQQELHKKIDNLGDKNIIAGDITAKYEDLVLFNDITLPMRNLLNAGLNQAASLYKNGMKNDQFLTDFAEVYQALMDVPADARNNLIQQFTNNGFTKGGLQKTLAYIKNNKITLSDTGNTSLDSLIKNSLVNIQLDIDTARSSLIENLEKIEGLASSLSGFKGSKLEDVNKNLKALGLAELEDTDFVMDGDNLALSYENTAKILNTLKDKYKEAFSTTKSDLDDAANKLTSNRTNIEAARTVFGGDFETIYKKIEKNGQTTWELADNYTDEEFAMKIEEYRTKTTENLNGYFSFLETMFGQLLKSTAWNYGDYSSLVNTGLFKTQEEVNTRLLQLASSTEQLSSEELKQPDIASARDKIREAYSSLISDVLDKGMKNINLKDYKGLIGIAQNDIQGSYRKFIVNYGERTGKAAAEINDLLIEAIKKDQSKTSSDVLKDLTFVNKDQFTTSLDGMKELAKIFEVSAKDFNKWITDYYDASTDQATIKVSELLAKYDIDLTKVNDFNQMVQESIDSLFSSLTSDISNALKGSLSSKGTKNLSDTLNNLLKPYNKSIDLTFTRTRDGYKLSTDQVEKLYEELKKVDALSAQIVLDELNKSIDESIVGAKNLNKEIAAMRATTESSDFKFMSSDIPSGQKNPLNYFGDWGKAWKTLQDSFKKSGADKGKIGYEDFYRIMTEMGRIAQESGEPIQIGANKFVTDAESAAALIEEGAAAMTVAADGSIKVDLTKFGMDFASGGKDMLKGVDSGIKAVAKAQIKILDAEIAMLEAIVAMQELNIAGEDNKVDLSDIFDFDQGGKLQSKVSTLLTFLNTSIAEFSVGGQSLNEVLFSRLNPEELVQFFSQLNTIITDPDCDPATIKARITSLIQEFFPQETVEVNDAIFGMLSFDKETLGPDLYNKIVEMLEDKLSLSEASKQGVISKIKEKNKELGTLLETLLKQNGNISFATALKIAAEITQNGSITENENGTWSYTYDGITVGGYKTEALARAAMEAKIIEKYQNDDYSSTVSANGTSQNQITVLKNGTVVNKRTLTNGGTIYMVGDTPLTWDGTDQSLIDALDKSSIGENGDITFKDTKGRTITITSNGTVGYTCTVDDTTNTTIYTRNGKTLKCTTGSVKQTELDEFFAGERTFVDTISIDDEGNETPITLVRSVSGIEYDTSFDPTTRKYTINGQYASDTPEAAAKAYEAANPPTTQTTTEEDKGIKIFTWHYNGVAIEITYDEKTKTYSVNGTPIVGATTPDEAISQANQSGIIQLEDLQATQDVYVKQNIKTEEDEYDKLKRFLHGQKGHLSQDTVNEFGVEFGLTKTGDNYNVESDKQFANYINSLYEKAVNQKQVLTKTEQEIIGILKDTKGLYGHIDDDYYKKIEEISKANDYNLDNITTPLTELNQLFVSDNITSLNDALNSLLTTLSLLENVNLTSVVQTINDIQAITNGNNGEGELTLNIKFTDDQKEAISNKIDELIQKIITPQTMPIIPDIDEEVIKNYTPPTKIMYIRQKILEATDSGASGNFGKKETTVPHYTQSTGNIALAQGTLMGELGPELVVSNGHYFVAGQNGAEFVNLDADAIVFNHLQTKALLEKGMSSSRGKAVTSERNAVSYATGNVSGGPAMASASAALSALKQLRAQWQALAGLSVKDFAGKGGGGGGGGDPKAFTKELEKWYNWLQQIAKLEKELTLEDAKRAKIQSDMYAHGQDYYKSQMQSLNAMKQTLVVQESLATSQEAYFTKRQQELNKQSAFSALYGFSESGQLYYKQGEYKDGKTAFEWLSDLAGRNAATGEANYTAKEQYDKLVEAGFGFAMEYDSSGNKIDTSKEGWENTALQAFWDKIDADKDEMQSLHDSVEDYKTAALKTQDEMNKILREIEDNQISVENKVLHAIEDTAQRQIDEMEEEKSAIQEANNNLITGLSDALSRERQMYENTESERDLESKRRQLAILQRSGGSATEINSLMKEITNDSRELYFQKQQDQIDAIQEASDKQIEKLEQQINIQKETLEYQKQHGLLWTQVYEVMSQSPQQIAEYIKANDSAYWGKSPADLAKSMREDLYEAQRWVAYAEDEATIADLVTQIADEVVEARKKEAKKSEAQNTTTSNTTNAKGGTAGNSSNASKKSSKSNTTENDDVKNQTKYYEFTFNGKTYKNKAIGLTDERLKEKVYERIDGMTPDAEVNAFALKMMRDTAKSSFKILSLDKGGMIDKNQYALVHAKESVLTAEQTAVLRNDILSKKSTSLLTLLTDFRDAYGSIANTSYNNSNNAVTIEHAEVNVHVAKLDNKYDAGKAGEDIMEKMLNIARKTGGNNRVGR